MSVKQTDPFLAELIAASPMKVRRLSWNVVEITSNQLKPGLKANGLDDSWCHKRRSEMNPEEREMRILCDRARHQLKLRRRAERSRDENR